MSLIVPLYLILCVACAGGIPKIPNTADEILAEGDKYFENKQYTQSEELYKAFLSRHPGHDRSDYAQYMLGESNYNKREFPLAAVEYQILMNNYGYSEYIDDALFKLGLCYYNESPRPERDQQMARDALSRFNQFLQTYPNSPLVPEVEEYVKLIHLKLAEKTFDTGYYYFRRKKLVAAMIYFDKVIDNYPDNEYWARSLFFKAQALEKRGRKEEAIRHYATLLTYPDDLSYKGDARRRLEELRQ
jgi:outer membrane protein assembly factor BamD